MAHEVGTSLRGYLTPAVSGSPTASRAGAKSEVAHKWANLATSPLSQCSLTKSFWSSLLNCNVPQLDVNPEIPNPSGGTMQNNSVITADLTNRTFGA